jgi:hypothetical protein
MIWPYWTLKIRRLFRRPRWFRMAPVSPCADPVIILVRGLDGVDRQLKISSAESAAINERARKIGMLLALKGFLVS